MEASSKTFREVEFREKMRGYHPEDVDQFLEQMATAVDALQDRLAKAIERAQRAESAAASSSSSDTSSSDETLRRTLVLAQRTADAAIAEAREQASRIVSAADQQAQNIVTEAEDRARRLHGEALADVHAELAKLESTRNQAQQEVDALNQWATEHRAHLGTTLRDALAMIDRAGVLSPPPTSSPIETPYNRPSASSSLPQTSDGPPAPEPRNRERLAPPPDPGPPTEAVSVPVGAGANGTAKADHATEQPATPVNGTTAVATGEAEGDSTIAEPDDEAMDNFFEEGEFENEPRFGGRLRRRR